MAPERKRANVFGDDDPTAAGNSSPPVKKAKGNAPAAPSFVPSPIPSGGAPSLPANPATISAEIAAKRAEIQAKMAAMMRKPAPSSATPPPPPSHHAPPPPPPAAGRPQLDPELAKKVAEAKRQVEMMRAKQAAAQKPINPYLTAGYSDTSRGSASPSPLDASIAGRGGLSMTAHPLLAELPTQLAQSKKERYKPMAPKFSTTKANSRMPPPAPKLTPVPVAAPEAPLAELESTPYFDPRLGYGSAGTSGKGHMGKGHERKKMSFNPKGKYVRLGEAIRAEEKMEDLKRRILEGARKAGLESELEDQAKAVKRPAPPDVEWWDTPFVPTKSYDSFDPAILPTLITHYIQHPIQIPAPGDKIHVEAKPLFLTKKEMKKMRRQRRKAALEDKQDRIKMGLLPVEPPKVKLSNMMRVLTQDAIVDPTKVEAKVRREMEARKKGHLRMNEDRKLSDEARKAKAEEKLLKDEAKGIHAAAFKIRYLSNQAHKFKISKNAEQEHLTGVTLFNPKFCLVIVEGGMKAIKFYKRLMLHRVQWTEEAIPRPGDEPADSFIEGAVKGEDGEDKEPESLADNYCKLIWEGSHREKMFAYFKRYNCPSEAMAKEVLGPKLEGLWDTAKSEGIDEE